MPNHRQGWRGGWNGWTQQPYGRWSRDAEGTEKEVKHEAEEGWSYRTRGDSGSLQDEGWNHSWRSWPRDKGWKGWSNGSRRGSGSVQEEGWNERWRQWSQDEGFKTKPPQKHEEGGGLDQRLQRQAAGRLFARALRSAAHPQRRAEPEASQIATAPAPAPRETWAAYPKESDIHSKMCSLGRVDPFEVGYACTSIPDHQPEGRAPNQPLSRVWQSAKVLDHAVDKVVYIGYEQPIEVFRAILPSGREQLLTTEGWKLWILQRSALARFPKKALIAPKILMDEEAINEKIKAADIPEDVDATYLKSEDGTSTHFSWRAVVASKSKAQSK
ncbi:unnamed protein product [Symbiodinium microadriaticum]|nr:unnamed protein product [Symbiodinium sp. KB8]CAE7602009.1 unnamed protein product [Symbiodinium microadriaticum]